MKRYFSLILAIAATVSAQIVPSTGNVRGPTSATDNAVARYDGTTGKLIQNSGVTIDDSGNATAAGAIISTGSTTEAAANRSVLDYVAGSTTRLISYGPNASTPGAFQLVGLSSDASAGDIRFSISSSGNATFAGTIQANGGTASISHAASAANIVFKATTNAYAEINANSAIGEFSINSGPSAGWGGFLTWKTDTTERMRLTNTGILTLSTITPPAWDTASFKVIVAGSNAFGGTNTGSNNLILASNTYFDGSVFKYATTGYATAYRQLVGEHYFYVAASGTAGNTTSLTTAVTIKQGGTLRFDQYGAGTLTTDSSGNITATSDERAKNITGTFTKGLAEVVKLTPKRYTWKPETGLNTTDEVASLTAQDLIAAGIPEAVSTYRTVADLNDDGTQKLDADGRPLTKRIDATYTVSDRAVIAALVNAVKELKAEVDALKAARK